MEGIRATRRAASHGALNAAYNNQARPTPRSLSRQGSQTNLKGTTDYPTLLPLPGPLESMLKTTTETGDIGAFSIRPSATFHQLPRQRSAFWDDGLRSTPRRQTESVERCAGRFRREDDRRRLPSYRDPSTSDIISMYGSGSQRSGSSFRPLLLDEMGPRSYSMTSSYGARNYHQSHSHSSGHVHGSSPSYLQRPRSPFPYPTRLKRPGVRPSSPALTENGNVDYTRMIGIDHVSYVTDLTQRTDYHRSYRQPPLYHQSSHRRPPLSLRPDVNRPMRSYPSQSSYRSKRTSSSGVGLHEQYAHGRPVNPWNHHPSEISDYGPTDMNARNSSFGSIIDKYQYSSPIDTGSQNLHVPSGPLYYDYSEDFDYPRQESNYRSRSPLVPMSAQTTNAHRALGHSDDCVSYPKSRFAPSLSGSSTPNADEDAGRNWLRCNDQSIGPHLPVPTSTPLGTQDLAAQPQIDAGSLIEPLGPQASRERSQISPVTPFETGPANFPTAMQSAKREAWCPQPTFLDENEQENFNTERRKAKSYTGPISSVHYAQLTGTVRRPLNATESLTVGDPAETALVRSGGPPVEPTAALSSHDNPNDPGSFVNKSQDSDVHCDCASKDMVDKRAKTHSLTYLDESKEGLETVKQGRLWRSPSSNGLIEKTRMIQSVRSLNNDFQATPYREHDPQALMRRHRRNQAMLRISQSSGRNLPAGGSPSRIGTPILAPKPISPAKELRVRNSIPQLMKALPALPGDSPPVSSSPDLLSEDADHEKRSTLMAPIIVSTIGGNRKSLIHPMNPEMYGSEATDSAEGQLNASDVGLRLAIPASRLSTDQSWIPPSDSHSAPKTDRTGTESFDKPAPLSRKGRKIRLRVLRDALNHLDNDDSSTVRRYPEAKCSNTILEISECYPDQHELQVSHAHDATARHESGCLDNGGFDETASLPAKSPPLYQADLEDGLTRGNSLDTHLERPLLSGTTIIATRTSDTYDHPSVNQQVISSDKHRGPRKHFSRMKLRLTESLTRRSGQELAEELRGFEATNPTARPGRIDEIQLLSSSGEAASLAEKLRSDRTSEIARVHSKGRVRQRFSRLVKGARKTFRLYMYKRP
ncbi:hypothetical protein PpBr36_05252 [Pyricularia pennisetigena]|uniref:hypothetical protein n=1 Tax=Pyricularia pennisetigena TaxID=1578925 RepID=UPI001150F1F8|nr:hypothetical protein PpBr36_05252 [Pyricularia pennisetigena]TLS26166.1 hypothetical protein PpBr36_05252 [Pyricularia pennisetigena]